MKQKTPTEQSSTKPTAEEIAALAFQYYLDRGGEPGREEEDWLRAERSLNEKAPRDREAVSA